VGYKGGGKVKTTRLGNGLFEKCEIMKNGYNRKL
jgi:hypothetical protein